MDNVIKSLAELMPHASKVIYRKSPPQTAVNAKSLAIPTVYMVHRLTGQDLAITQNNGLYINVDSSYGNYEIAPADQITIDGDKGLLVNLSKEPRYTTGSWVLTIAGYHCGAFKSKKAALAIMPTAAAVLEWNINQESNQVKTLIDSQGK